MLRGLLAIAAIGVITPSLLSFQLIAVRLGLAARRRIPVAFHRGVCACLGVRIRRIGRKAVAAPDGAGSARPGGRGRAGGMSSCIPFCGKTG